VQGESFKPGIDVSQATVARDPPARGDPLQRPLTQDRLAANVRSSLGLNLPQFYPQANSLNLIPNATFGGVPGSPAQLLVEGRFPFFGTNNIWNYSDNLSKVTGGTGNGLDSRVVVVDVVNKPGPNGEVFNVNAIKPPTAAN